MKTILSILLLSFISFDVSDDIINALKYNKYQDLYKFLEDKVIIRILDKEDLLSKEQCVANLSLFFEKNPIRNFTLIQNTTLSPNAQFIYGYIDTPDNKYKISILIKKSRIVQLRIDYFE
ncbi:MAG: hypothetical protein Fur0023_20200 [Bacteroidia bacterium]